MVCVKNTFYENAVKMLYRAIDNNENRPIDLDSLLSFLDGEIATSDDLPQYVDAQLIKTPAGFSIVIATNVAQNPHEKNFTIAHEVAHLLLHTLYKGADGYWNSIEEGTPVFAKTSRGIVQELTQEQEADDFAYTLLMPYDLFIKKIDEHSDYGELHQKYLKDIADFFQVSENDVIIRGRRLGIWQ